VARFGLRLGWSYEEIVGARVFLRQAELCGIKAQESKRLPGTTGEVRFIATPEGHPPTGDLRTHNNQMQQCSIALRRRGGTGDEG
jgi:hypothetical protein